MAIAQKKIDLSRFQSKNIQIVDLKNDKTLERSRNLRKKLKKID